MLRKISTFSHAHEIDLTWYNKVWLKWTPETENLHPGIPESFPKAVPEIEMPFKLEPYLYPTPGGVLHMRLKRVERTPSANLDWLKSDAATAPVVELVYRLVTTVINEVRDEPFTVFEYGTEHGHVYYSMCDALIKNRGDKTVYAYSQGRDLGATNETYKDFSVQGVPPDEFHVIHFNQTPSDKDMEILYKKAATQAIILVSRSLTVNRTLVESIMNGFQCEMYHYKMGEGLAIFQLRG